MKKRRTALKDLEVLVLDCQATHSNPDKGHILEIGWVKTRASFEENSGRISEKAETCLLKTPRGVEIPKAVLRITGISEEELNLAQAPKQIWQRLYRAAEDLTKKIGLEEAIRTVGVNKLQNLELANNSACPTVIHFCRYEEPFLRNLHKKYSPKKNFPLSIICTHEIAKRVLPDLPRKSLRAVAGYFGHSLPEPRRSSHHVAATALIWSHLVKQLADTHSINTFAELQDWLMQPPSHYSCRGGPREYPMKEIYRKDLPNLPGVYRMYRSGGDLLYIGKAKSLRQRVCSYFHKGSRHPEHMLEMLSQAKSLDTTVTHTATEAALVESDEIKRFNPPYNRALRTNEREVLFFSQDLKSSNPQPDRFHSIGPLLSSYNLDPLILLTKVLNGDLRKISLKVIEGILDIPPAYLPDRSCFVLGVKAFRQEFQTSFRPAFGLTACMSLGAKFWKEKLEERADEEAAKKSAMEEAAKKKEKTALVREDEQILELETQELEDRRIEDTWTPERIVKILKSIIRLGAFQIRRSRWFCRLSESTLVWTPLAGESELKNLIVFNGGTPIFEDSLLPSDTVPLSPGLTNPLVDRQKNFDLFVFDRMRVTTTEIRRLIQEGRRIELHLHPNMCLQNDQLKRMLPWV